MRQPLPTVPSICNEQAFRIAVTELVDAAVKLEKSKEEDAPEDIILQEYNEACLEGLCCEIDTFCLKMIVRFAAEFGEHRHDLKELQKFLND